MKLFLRILTAPLSALLAIIVWITSGLLRCSAWVFGLAAVLVGILGVAEILFDSVQNGIILMVIAFLVSPVGIPLALAWLTGQLQRLRFALRG